MDGRANGRSLAAALCNSPGRADQSQQERHRDDRLSHVTSPVSKFPSANVAIDMPSSVRSSGPKVSDGSSFNITTTRGIAPASSQPQLALDFATHARRARATPTILTLALLLLLRFHIGDIAAHVGCGFLIGLAQ